MINNILVGLGPLHMLQTQIFSSSNCQLVYSHGNVNIYFVFKGISGHFISCTSDMYQYIVGIIFCEYIMLLCARLERIMKVLTSVMKLFPQPITLDLTNYTLMI